jgi:peroxin-19
MGELVSKDVLYEPMKDLKKQYPEWISKNRSELSPEDAQKYQKQLEIITQIVDAFESQEGMGEQETQKITDLMQEMQALGNPPEGLLKELTPTDASAEMPPECNQM